MPGFKPYQPSTADTRNQYQQIVREVGEELSCAVEVTGWLAGSSPIGTSHVLTVALVRSADEWLIRHYHVSKIEA